MEKSALPKVLVVGISSWDKKSGSNTLQNIFKCWDKDKLSYLYTRSGLPNSDICDNFFRISENQLIKSVLTRRPIGQVVTNTNAKQEDKDLQTEIKRYKKANMRKSWIMTFVRDAVWKFSVWKTKSLTAFLESTNPDVLFISIYPTIYMCRLQLYLIKKVKKPYLCYLSDDNYSYKPCGKNLLALLYRFFLRKYVRKIATGCAQMFTITETQAIETDSVFKTSSKILTKGIDFSHLTYTEPHINDPLHLVYTGNLLIGRLSTICEVAKAVAKINENGVKIVFDIYSQTAVKEKILKILNSKGTIFHGEVSREQIDDIQKKADILLFAESLEKRYQYAARLSFSTKLTDYFASGKCIFAIGNSSIAPVQYLQKNDCALIASNYQSILPSLLKITNDRNLILDYSRKAYECGLKNHNKLNIDEFFMNTVVEVSKMK